MRSQIVTSSNEDRKHRGRKYLPFAFTEDEHDAQLKSIYDAIEDLLDEKAEEKDKEKKWEEREMIGFKQGI